VLAVIVVWVDYSWLPPFVIIKFAIVILVIEIRQKRPRAADRTAQLIWLVGGLSPPAQQICAQKSAAPQHRGKPESQNGQQQSRDDEDRGAAAVIDQQRTARNAD